MTERAPVREWFEDAERQAYASSVGMWLFLGSELLLFAGLFALYWAYRVVYPVDFAAAAHHNEVVIGTANTYVLITSSFTVAWAIHSLRAGGRRMAVLAIAATLVLASVFLVLKGVEYSHHFEDGILPGSSYAFSALPAPGARLFFTLYYFMTGLHGLHVVGGMTALAVVGYGVHRGTIGPAYPTALENAALYWHLVDAIWIFLWPLLYLVG